MVAVMKEPQEIEDEEYEQVLERVAAIDVAKASGMVCTRVPHESRPGKRRTRVREVDATTNAVLELAGQLAGEGIEKVTLEATSDYWRIWFYLLEAAGLDVQLVNARDVKNAPGRPKTDKLDAVWLAKLTERGMLRPSFVPPAEIRQLRDYTRLRLDLTRDRTRHWQRLEKLLEDALIKMSAVASSLTTASARDMIEALIAGERDPRVLAELARGRMRAKRPALVEALTGSFDDHHAELARMLLDQIDSVSVQVDKLTSRIGERGKLRALVAVARTILVIIWHLLADPAARYHDLGAGYYASRIDTDKKTRNHIRQLEALGFTVTLPPAA
jgi:transposase